MTAHISACVQYVTVIKPHYILHLSQSNILWSLSSWMRVYLHWIPLSKSEHMKQHLKIVWGCELCTLQDFLHRPPLIKLTNKRKHLLLCTQSKLFHHSHLNVPLLLPAISNSLHSRTRRKRQAPRPQTCPCAVHAPTCCPSSSVWQQ